jgi:hypothetical protein
MCVLQRGGGRPETSGEGGTIIPPDRGPVCSNATLHGRRTSSRTQPRSAPRMSGEASPGALRLTQDSGLSDQRERTDVDPAGRAEVAGSGEAVAGGRGPKQGAHVPNRGEGLGGISRPASTTRGTASAPTTPAGSGGGAFIITPWKLWAGRRRARSSDDRRRPAAEPSCPRAVGNPPARGQRGAGASSLGGFSTARQFPRQQVERPKGADRSGRALGTRPS